MIRSAKKAVHLLFARLARAHRALAAFPALLLLALPPAAIAGPPSAAVEEHLIAQAGFSIGVAWNHLAQLFTSLEGASSTCTANYGDNVYTLGRSQVFVGSHEVYAVGVYYDSVCSQPFLTDNIEAVVSGGTTLDLAHTIHIDAPNQALLGDLSLAQQFFTASTPNIINEKGTYKAVAGTGQLPVRTGFACAASGTMTTTTLVCQEGIAQDFPSLKMSLGTIANFTMTLTEISSTILTVSVSGASAKLATAKPGALSIIETSPSALGFQGQHQVVGSGATSGSSPALSVVFPTSTVWTFNDSQHSTKFSISTAPDLSSNGKVRNSSTNATATFTVDKSGTGTMHYSDNTTAKITNWTLAD